MQCYSHIEQPIRLKVLLALIKMDLDVVGFFVHRSLVLSKVCGISTLERSC